MRDMHCCRCGHSWSDPTLLCSKCGKLTDESCTKEAPLTATMLERLSKAERENTIFRRAFGIDPSHSIADPGENDGSFYVDAPSGDRRRIWPSSSSSAASVPAVSSYKVPFTSAEVDQILRRRRMESDG